MSSTNVDILKSLCRLCAKQDKHCVNVFSNDGNKHFIQKKIRLCLPITIKEHDVMPRQICLSCLNKLDTCYELYSGCVSAQSTIKKLIESTEEEEVSITAVSYPNPLIKVRKAVGSDLSPSTSASSPISLHDYLKQDCSQPVTNKIVPDINQQKPANEDNETTAKFQRLTDSGFPRIKVRQLDTDIRTVNESVDRSNDRRKSPGTELANNNSLSTASVLTTVENEVSGFPRIKVRKLDTDVRTDNESVDRRNDRRKSPGTELANNNSLSAASVLTTVENEVSGFPRIKVRKLDTDVRTDNESVDRSNDRRKSPGTELANNNSLSTASVLTIVENEVSASNSLPTMSVPIIANAVTIDLTSNQNHPLPEITNLQSTAKPVSCMTSSAPTKILNSDSGGYQMATQSMNNMQPPQNIYLTSISDSIVNSCTQMLATPISSTYVASQTLVSSPLITSAYITAAPSNANQVTQTITPNFLIQQQPVNSGTTSSNTLVYMNTLNPVTDLLSQNTSQHISYTVTPATSNNTNLLLTHNLQNQSSSSLNSDESPNFNKLASNSTAGKTLTTATSSNLVSHTPVISNVHSVPLKTYERVRHMSDSVSQNVAAKSSIRNNGSLSPEITLNAGKKHRRTDILQNLLTTSSNSETCNPNIKNGNVGKKIITNNNGNRISQLNSQNSIHVPNTNASKIDSFTAKYFNNMFINALANNLKSVHSSQTGSKQTAPPPPVFLGQKGTVAAGRSVNNPQPHIVATSRTSIDANSQAMNGSSVGQAAVSNSVYAHVLRPASSPAVSSTLPKNSTFVPAILRRTPPRPSSASKSQVYPASLLPTTSAGTTTASPTTPVNSVSDERLVLVGGLKLENEMIPTRTLMRQADSSAVVASSSSSNSPDALSENEKNVLPVISENTCPYCLKDFPPDVLIHHKVLHFRERFFSCIDCNKNFKTEIGLQKHRCEVE